MYIGGINKAIITQIIVNTTVKYKIKKKLLLH